MKHTLSRILAVCLALAMMLTAVACGSDQNKFKSISNFDAFYKELSQVESASAMQLSGEVSVDVASNMTYSVPFTADVVPSGETVAMLWKATVMEEDYSIYTSDGKTLYVGIADAWFSLTEEDITNAEGETVTSEDMAAIESLISKYGEDNGLSLISPWVKTFTNDADYQYTMTIDTNLMIKDVLKIVADLSNDVELDTVITPEQIQSEWDAMVEESGMTIGDVVIQYTFDEADRLTAMETAIAMTIPDVGEIKAGVSYTATYPEEGLNIAVPEGLDEAGNLFEMLLTMQEPVVPEEDLAFTVQDIVDLAVDFYGQDEQEITAELADLGAEEMTSEQLEELYYIYDYGFSYEAYTTDELITEFSEFYEMDITDSMADVDWDNLSTYDRGVFINTLMEAWYADLGL